MAMNSSHVAGAASGRARLFDEPRVPALDDHVEEERPDVELALVGRLVPNRRNQRIEQPRRQIRIPRLDDAGVRQLDHLQEGRDADVHVPGALLVLGFGDEAVDAEILGRRNFGIDRKHLAEVRVDVRNGRMELNDPVVIGDFEFAVVGRERRAHRLLRQRRQHRRAQPERRGAAQQRPPVEPAGQRVRKSWRAA